MKRTWAEIDLDAIKHNFLAIKKFLNEKTKVMCVIKADAYGHGSEFLSKEYESLNADWFAVSNLDEAIQLRLNGVTKPILILGFTPVNMASDLSKFNITQTVFSKDYAEALNESARAIGETVNVHIKLDTGMSRIGFMFQSEKEDLETINDIESVSRLKNIFLEGIFTHFSVADENGEGKQYTQKQFHNFMTAVDLLKKRGVTFSLRHCCNSGGIIDYPEMHLDMVRAGVILYGLLPSKKLRNSIDLVPAMQLKTVISQIKKIRPHSSVSYGRTFNSEAEMTVATVPIGYADGYLRSLSGKSVMLINGKKAPVIGRICMDQLMLDVSKINDISTESIVTVFGESEGEKLSVDELADISGTINYEFVCLIGKRVPRIYLKNGQNVGQINYILKNSSSL